MSVSAVVEDFNLEVAGDPLVFWGGGGLRWPFKEQHFLAGGKGLSSAVLRVMNQTLRYFNLSTFESLKLLKNSITFCSEAF